MSSDHLDREAEPLADLADEREQLRVVERAGQLDPVTQLRAGRLVERSRRSSWKPSASSSCSFRLVRRNAQRMLSLVEDLLVAGRAVRGSLGAHPSDVTLTEAVDRIVDALGPTIPAVARSLDGWHLQVDATHLHQVLGNLLSNATKYGAVPISITASTHEPGRVTVDVADDGPGVPEGFVAQMWDRFSQADHGNARVTRGVGLGLAIVRLLIEVDGGHVGYQAGIPTGAVFSFDLPGYFDPAGDIGVPAVLTATEAELGSPAS